jgi:sterol desaturase/sphingolipid hydroxylase (fatty acid hydroxylase superfamily)
MAVFPVVTVGAVAGSIALIERDLPTVVVLAAPVLVAYLLVMVLERVVPFHDSWLNSRGDVSVDLGHLLVSGIAGLELLRPAMLGLAVVLGGWISAHVADGLWPSHWSYWSQLLLALVIGEFFMYWVHRLAHEVEWLWRFHAVHHSAPRLYFLNAARFHPVDLAISNFAPFIPLVALGANEYLLALFAVFSAVHGIFQHANLPLKLGPLNWFFSMAELHRWHHSPVLTEANSNYGQNLILWDIVFGTRFLPRDREPPEEIGLAPGLERFPMDYLGQLASPFSWRAIERESRRSTTEPAKSG